MEFLFYGGIIGFFVTIYAAFWVWEKLRKL